MSRPGFVIRRDGSILGIYSDAVPYRTIAEGMGGELKVERASRVEPTEAGRWQADLAPVGGPVLGDFERRREALEAEDAWLREHVLGVSER